MGVAENLEHSVLQVGLLSITRIGEHGVLRRQRELGRKPSNGVDVDHALHVEQVDGDLDGVTLADLVDRLHVRPIDQLRNLKIVELVRVLELLQLLLLLLFILVKPQNSVRSLGLDVHLVVGTVEGRRVLVPDLGDAALVVVGMVEVKASLGELVSETGH